MPVRGFILHPTYRIEAGRAVVHLFGRLETGESFLIRDGRLRPYFFVRAADAERARGAGAARIVPVDLRTMQDEPVVRVEVPSPPDTVPLRDALHAGGVPTYEADVRFAMRYLIDRGIRGSIRIEGGEKPPGKDGEGGRRADVARSFEQPDLAPSNWRPAPADLRIVSLDIETDPRGREVRSAALTGAGVDEVHLAAPAERVRAALAGSHHAVGAKAWGDETGLLRGLFERLREIDFDILTGWNVIDFDLAVLAAASRRLGVPFEAGRLPGVARVVRETSFLGRSRATIKGRVVLDGIDLLKGAFVRLPDYRLETAAREMLGEGKVALDGGSRGGDRAGAIERAFRGDLPRFVEYNRADARLVLRILESARLIELVVERALLTGMPPDRVGASIASFDFLYLGEMRRRGRVAPSVGARSGEGEPTAGGAVLDPVPGLYDNVLAFDFKSLYPSLIRTFNIDPLGLVPEGAPAGGDDSIRAPNGARFARAPGILPEMLADLFPRRDAAKRRGDAIAAHALKILMNSFYGVLATPACRFYSSPVANAITHSGQWILRWARDRMEALGHRVLYGDTDSLFALSGIEGRDARGEVRRLGEDLGERITAELAATIRSTWRVESHLELEFELLFLELFLPAVRGGGAGARKRYAGLVDRPGAPGGEELLFVGMEIVRRDWTDLSKRFQRGLFERLFKGTARETAAEYVREFVRDLREGRYDAELVYRKALRKDVSEYTTTTPPHVKAARLMGGRVRGVVEYVMTAGGPEPAASRRSPIDYDHYVEKQIRPIAEQVLPHLGLDFEAALGGPTQGRLF